MMELKRLDQLFNNKIFRITDNQKGYEWQKSQLQDFWQDLINLYDERDHYASFLEIDNSNLINPSEDRTHYAGILTLKRITESVTKTDVEYWLIDEKKYEVYNVIDGQQRLTTVIIMLKAFIDVIKKMKCNEGILENNIYITPITSLTNIIEKYLYQTSRNGIASRTYMLGYDKDNPNYNYMKSKIFMENYFSVDETLYTLNLKNAYNYFKGQLTAFYESDNNFLKLVDIYKKLTKKLLFNEYIIKD